MESTRVGKFPATLRGPSRHATSENNLPVEGKSLMGAEGEAPRAAFIAR